MQDSPALENVCTWKCTSNRPERRGDTGWQLWMRNTKPMSHGQCFLWLVTNFGAPLPLHNLCTFDLFLTQCNVRSIASPPFQFLYSPYHQQAEKYLEDLPDSCKLPLTYRVIVRIKWKIIPMKSAFISLALMPITQLGQCHKKVRSRLPTKSVSHPFINNSCCVM